MRPWQKSFPDDNVIFFHDCWFEARNQGGRGVILSHPPSIPTNCKYTHILTLLSQQLNQREARHEIIGNLKRIRGEHERGGGGDERVGRWGTGWAEVETPIISVRLDFLKCFQIFIFFRSQVCVEIFSSVTSICIVTRKFRHTFYIDKKMKN